MSGKAVGVGDVVLVDVVIVVTTVVPALEVLLDVVVVDVIVDIVEVLVVGPGSITVVVVWVVTMMGKGSCRAVVVEGPLWGCIELAMLLVGTVVVVADAPSNFDKAGPLPFLLNHVEDCSSDAEQSETCLDLELLVPFCKAFWRRLKPIQPEPFSSGA